MFSSLCCYKSVKACCLHILDNFKCKVAGLMLLLSIHRSVSAHLKTACLQPSSFIQHHNNDIRTGKVSQSFTTEDSKSTKKKV